MEVPDPHIRMNQISAISNTGEVRFMTYAKAMNAALFLAWIPMEGEPANKSPCKGSGIPENSCLFSIDLVIACQE
jgi:hypothetical protein